MNSFDDPQVVPNYAVHPHPNGQPNPQPPAGGSVGIGTPIPEAQQSQDESISTHVVSLTRDALDLFRNEIELAKAEARENVETMKRGVAEVAIGAAAAAGGALVLLAAMVLLLGLVMPHWAAALLVGLGAVGTGMVLLGKGKDDSAPSNLIPSKTMAAVQRDHQLIKEHTR